MARDCQDFRLALETGGDSSQTSCFATITLRSMFIHLLMVRSSQEPDPFHQGPSIWTDNSNGTFQDVIIQVQWT